MMIYFLTKLCHMFLNEPYLNMYVHNLESSPPLDLQPRNCLFSDDSMMILQLKCKYLRNEMRY